MACLYIFVQRTKCRGPTTLNYLVVGLWKLPKTTENYWKFTENLTKTNPNPSPQLYVVSLCYTNTQHRTHAGDRRALLHSCSNVNNDEKFRTQSLQQLQYRAVHCSRFYWRKMYTYCRKFHIHTYSAKEVVLHQWHSTQIGHWFCPTGAASAAPCHIFTGRMPRSGKLPVLNLLTGQKSAFSPRRGDSLHRFTWNLARPSAHGSTWPHKIARQSVHRGGERCPQNIKNFHFW